MRDLPQQMPPREGSKKMKKWETEPNELNFESHGFQCNVWRNSHSGCLCGYVGVKNNHPLHGKDYDDTIIVPDTIKDRPIDVDKIGILSLLCSGYDESKPNDMKISLAFDVHGGLTFAGRKKDSDPDIWWFGFDTCHANDVIVYENDNDRKYPILTGEYRDFNYVKAETQRLARMLKSFDEMEKEQKPPSHQVGSEVRDMV